VPPQLLGYHKVGATLDININYSCVDARLVDCVQCGPHRYPDQALKRRQGARDIIRQKNTRLRRTRIRARAISRPWHASRRLPFEAPATQNINIGKVAARSLCVLPGKGQR
jgi:hypothetical protein